MHSCIFGLFVMIIIIVPIIGTLDIFWTFLIIIVLVLSVFFEGCVFFCFAKIKVFVFVFICIVPIVHSCREVVGNIVIKVKDIILGGRFIVWIISRVVVLINGFLSRSVNTRSRSDLLHRGRRWTHSLKSSGIGGGSIFFY